MSLAQQDSVLWQAWLEEQVALYQSHGEDPRRPSPVEFAARAMLPKEAARVGYDLRTKLVQRLRILDGLRHALGGDEVPEEGFRPGDVFQDLEILEPIGTGGMGRIYRARQISVDRVVALKTPHWAASLDPREKARFWREAQAIAKLRHPGIVPLYAVGERGGTPFLVLEHVEGRSLSEVIRDLKGGSLPRTGTTLGRPTASFEHAAAEFALEILAALQAAHEAGIVHRDVKPGNVMLESSGRARVLDFGLAKMQRAGDLTRSQELVGTIEFIAPEVLENPRNASPASDVYSVGVVLYELVSLERPFGDLPLHAILKRAMEVAPEPLHRRCRVSKTLSAVVARAMDRDLTLRYRSAREFAGDLDAFLRGSEVSARPSSWWIRLPGRVRKHVHPSGVVLALTTLAILALAWKLLSRLGQFEERVVQAEARLDQGRGDPVEVRDLQRRALVWEYADLPAPGERPGSTSGREQALEILEAIARDDPSVLFPRAHLHLAVLRAERGDAEGTARLLDVLASAGWEYETMQWIRDRLAAEAPVGAPVQPPAGRGPESLGNDVDRFYFVRGRAPVLGRDDFLQAAASLEDHPIYGAAVLLLAGVRLGEGAEPDFAGSIAKLEAAQALVPHHPVVVSQLLRHVCQHLPRQGVGGPEAAEMLAPLRAAAESVARGQPVLAGFWGAYGELLVLLGDRAGARAVLLRGIESSPDDEMLLGQGIQACLDEIAYELGRGETVPDAPAGKAIELLGKALRRNPESPENLSRLAELRGLPLSPQHQERLTALEGELDRLRAEE